MSNYELLAWLRAEYDKAREAQRDARGCRNSEGNSHALEHASASARVCALGQVLERIEPT